MFTRLYFFHALSQMEWMWDKYLCQEERVVYFNIQKVSKYQRTGRGETNKIKLGKPLNYLANYPQKCWKSHSNSALFYFWKLDIVI